MLNEAPRSTRMLVRAAAVTNEVRIGLAGRGTLRSGT